ncbi:helix-turn-helix domain-containing protein [Mycobacterium dioxanotrophicus]|nr:helix-turn-helix transcriptional regulator [Mycobacterium dioxanotrophicus]
MDDPSPAGLISLASAIQARMDILGLTIQEIGDRGGPKRAAMRELINARRVPRKSTLIEIDRVLGWPAGLCKDVLEGNTSAPAPTDWLELPDQNRIGLVRSQLVTLRKEHSQLVDFHRERVEQIDGLLDLLDQELGGG